MGKKTYIDQIVKSILKFEIEIKQKFLFKKDNNSGYRREKSNIISNLRKNIASNLTLIAIISQIQHLLRNIRNLLTNFFENFFTMIILLEKVLI